MYPILFLPFLLEAAISGVRLALSHDRVTTALPALRETLDLFPSSYGGKFPTTASAHKMLQPIVEGRLGTTVSNRYLHVHL